MSTKIRIKHSATANDTPTAAQIPDAGELAINTNSTSLRLFARDSAGNVRVIGGNGSSQTGALGYWNRTGTNLYPVNGAGDSVRIGGTNVGSPGISLSSNGSASFSENGVFIYDKATASGTIRLGETTGNTFGGLAMYRSSQSSAGQFFRCFSGATREQVFELDEQGTVKIGGTLPGSPNISLYNNGTIQSGGARGADDAGNSFESYGLCRVTRASTTAQPEIASLFEGYLGSTQTSTIFADGSIGLGGSVSVTPNIRLDSDGSAVFRAGIGNSTSAFVIGPDAVNSETYYGVIGSGGNFNIFANNTGLRLSDNDQISSTPKVEIRADGSADYKGKITIDRGAGTEDSACFETYVEGNRKSIWTGDGSLYLGMTANAISTAKCSLLSDGSAEFADGDAGFSASGHLSKTSGTFKISHPLPELNKTHHLVHSFIEGPQADLIYRGQVDLVGGTATINLDTFARMTEGTFVLLNTNISCFTSNESDWTAVRGSVSGNILTIEAQDDTCTATVSWMVVGERHDQHMIDTEWTDENGRVITEPLKPVTMPAVTEPEEE